MSMDRATEANRAAVASSLLAIVGTGVTLPGFWHISGPDLRVVQGAVLIINAAALWVLRARRIQGSELASNLLFLLLLVPTVIMVWKVDEARALHSARWVPFEPNKLSALALAMIAPPAWWVGITGILMFVGSAVVHDLVVSDVVRARMAAGEPLGVVAYGVFALVLLGVKQRGRILEATLAHERSEKIALERVARVAMSLRDLANTPTQTLELIRQTLVTCDPRLEVQAERMGRALERLRRLNEILGAYQSAVTWDSDGDASFDGELQAGRPAPRLVVARGEKRSRGR